MLFLAHMVDDFKSWRALALNGANMTLEDTICRSTPIQSLIAMDQKLVLRDMLLAKNVSDVPESPRNAESLVPLLVDNGLLGNGRRALNELNQTLREFDSASG